MKNRTRILLSLSGVCVFLATASALFQRFLLYDHRGKPFCHKNLRLALDMWCDENQTKDFPNLEGKGYESLTALREQLATKEVEENYRYIPGLRQGDPGHLVLLYYSRPTRWTLHIQTPTIFTQKAWIVVPVDFTWEPPRRRPRGPGEFSERLSQDEFKKALAETLDFLRTNERPNWKAVVAEHSGLLR